MLNYAIFSHTDMEEEMKIFTSSKKTETVGRSEKKLYPPGKNGHLSASCLGVMATYMIEDQKVHLIFNIPLVKMHFFDVYVDLKNLSTGESIAVSQTEKQIVVLDPKERYILAIIMTNKAEFSNDQFQDTYCFEFEPEDQPE
jgi:hypothetical protein